MILLSPLAGRLLDRTSPAGMMAGAGVLLALHSALLAVTWSVWTLLASYVLFGAAMTAVNLSWNLGPVQFAPTEREATDYMAVHVTLTGVRGILAPGIAILAEGLLGLSGGFAVAAALYLLSAALMALLSRRQATPA